MKLFCPTCEIAKLDTQIQDLQQTLSNISERSTRLLATMEADRAGGLAVAGDVHM